MRLRHCWCLAASLAALHAVLTFILARQAEWAVSVAVMMSLVAAACVLVPILVAEDEARGLWR